MAEGIEIREELRSYKKLSMGLLAAVLVLAVAVVILSYLYQNTESYLHSISLKLDSISSNASSLSANSTPAHTLAGIDTPLNSTELSIINNAPASYFESAGEKLLNGSITNEIALAPVSNSSKFSAFSVNGKPSVIYIGAISCIYCGENRWAMALALSRFGSFSKLYEGYSSFGDGDIPTLYWNKDNYTTPAGVTFGNFYSSNYINFISSEYDSPITAGFEVQPLSYFIGKAPNSTYLKALSFMNSTNLFQGTPFTFWGNTAVTGADGVVFGNTTPTGSTLPIASMTHAQVLSQFKNFSDQFAWSEYAAADIYISMVCPSINNSASICQLPAIQSIEKIEGL